MKKLAFWSGFILLPLIVALLWAMTPFLGVPALVILGPFWLGCVGGLFG